MALEASSVLWSIHFKENVGQFLLPAVVDFIPYHLCAKKQTQVPNISESRTEQNSQKICEILLSKIIAFFQNPLKSLSTCPWRNFDHGKMILIVCCSLCKQLCVPLAYPAYCLIELLLKCYWCLLIHDCWTSAPKLMQWHKFWAACKNIMWKK